MGSERVQYAHLSEKEACRVHAKRRALMERDRKLSNLIPMLVMNKEDPAEIERARIEELSVGHALDLLTACRDGAFGTMPDRRDIVARDKIDLELSMLIGRRNMIAYRRSCARNAKEKESAESEFTTLVREIAMLETRRSVINVRLFNAKCVHDILSA